MRYYRVTEAARIIGVSASTLRAYERANILVPERNPGNQRIYSETLLDNFLEEQGRLTPKQGKIIHYARSSDGDQTKLNTQFQLLEEQYGKPDYIIQDKASGLNENRKGLSRIIKLVQTNEISTIYVTQKDRLTRFGYSYLETLFDAYGASIIILGNEHKTQTVHEELIQDFLSLLASFSGKYYRLRGYENQRKFLQTVKNELP